MHTCLQEDIDLYNIYKHMQIKCAHVHTRAYTLKHTNLCSSLFFNFCWVVYYEIMVQLHKHTLPQIDTVIYTAEWCMMCPIGGGQTEISVKTD